MYIKNNILYISSKEVEEIEKNKEKTKTEREKEEEQKYKKWIYDWDHNSMGAIMNH